MTDVREIPAKVFGEMTVDRAPEAHDSGIQTCSMDHGLWLRLNERPERHSTGLQVDWSWRDDLTAAEVAAEPRGDDSDIVELAYLRAGRHHTGVYSSGPAGSQGSYQFRQTVSVLVPRADFTFSDPRSAEGFIYGLRLIEEMSARSFVLLTIGDYDKGKFESSEVDLPY